MGKYVVAEGAFKIVTPSAFWGRARSGKQIVFFEVGMTQSSCVCLIMLFFLFVKNLANIRRCVYVFVCHTQKAVCVLYSRLRSPLQVVVVHRGGDHQLAARG